MNGVLGASGGGALATPSGERPTTMPGETLAASSRGWTGPGVEPPIQRSDPIVDPTLSPDTPPTFPLANGPSGGDRRAGDPEAAPGHLPPAPACTAPQLRRFIKSRPYVPMHELRRRFGINGGDDDVTAVMVGSAMIYLGLPSPEGSLLGELLRGGEVGYELSLDPRSPVVIGLYPMRPVARS